MAVQSGKILIIDLSNGKIKICIKPRYQLKKFNVNSKYLMIDDKLYESHKSNLGKVIKTNDSLTIINIILDLSCGNLFKSLLFKFKI